MKKPKKRKPGVADYEKLQVRLERSKDPDVEETFLRALEWLIALGQENLSAKKSLSAPIAVPEPDKETSRELVSTKTLAHLLDISQKTIQDWIYKDRKEHGLDPIPYYKLGGLVRFNLKEVRAWVFRRKVRPVNLR